MLALTLLAAGLGAAVNTVRPGRLPWRGDWARHVEARALRQQIRLAGLDTVRQAVNTGAPVLLDARPAADFRAGHLPRAQSLPFELAPELFAPLQATLTRAQPLLTYCTRNDCDEGLELALFLRQQGYTNVMLFPGGLHEWRAAGGAVEDGP
ncbi:MAG: rhodanese-like domain-containing protein [Kiritimatiellaeota bacterium]|nr:rhodanese-like domain-containing protein [Kiritimatiellota bacterium]